jgi:hypothetical protein
VRSFRAVAPVWPATEAQTDYPTAILRRRQRADRVQTWVLVASAFVLGLAIGAAVFVGAWRTTASQSDRADAARSLTARNLRDTRARSAALSTKLHRVKGDLASTRVREKQLKVKLRKAVRQAGLATQQAASAQAGLATLQHGASRVKSYVASLEGYVEATPSQDLDGGYLRSQLTFLSEAADRLQAP